MKLSPVYKARLEETKQQGIQQDIQQGIQQEATLVARQLRRKVGDLPVSLEEKVMSLSVNVLEDLGEVLLDFNSLDDLINWFNNH